MFILPLNERPPMQELHNSAFALSILTESNHFSEKWLLNTFIPIKFDNKYHYILMYDLPYFWHWDCFEWKISFHYPFKKVCNTIVSYLKQGQYVFLGVNDKFVPQRYVYGIKNLRHELLIYGYDEEHDSFLTIAYNCEARYKPQWISAKVIRQAFMRNSEHFYRFYAIKAKENFCFDCINFETMQKNINSYLHPSGKTKGHLAYKLMQEYAVPNLKHDKAMDFRSFRTIRDRANVFLLFEKYIIKDDLEVSMLLKNNVEISQKALNLVLKYNLTRKEELIQLIGGYINQYAQNEYKLLSKINNYIAAKGFREVEG